MGKVVKKLPYVYISSCIHQGESLFKVAVRISHRVFINGENHLKLRYVYIGYIIMRLCMGKSFLSSGMYTAISIKVVGSTQAYATRPKGSVGSCKST